MWATFAKLNSGVTRLQWAHVQVFQKGPLFPQKNFKKQRRANFGPPTALGPRALHALQALLLRHWNWNYFLFLSAIFISGVTATPGNVNIITIEKVIPKNIGTAVGILFLCALETK